MTTVAEAVRDVERAEFALTGASEGIYLGLLGRITPIVRGGITDKWLSDYPNLFADLSANSGNNALTRDPSFTADFLKRHKDKLFFGSDCSCSDGHGAGISQGGNPGAARLAGKCVARETLTVLKANTTPRLFRTLVWENGHRVYKLKMTTA